MKLMHSQVAFVGLLLVLATRSFTADELSAYDARDRIQALSRDESFYEIPSFRSADKVTHARLDVRMTESVLNGIPLRHRSYNNGLVGPVIRVRPGSTLRIRLVNHLMHESDSDSHDPNIPHAFNTTNLHTHGLHVSPSGKSDNVFISVPPGSQQDYEIQIPANHPSGTYWYHAHHHGAVALQLSSGMAGALIVEGGLDQMPAIADMREQILVLQQFQYRLIPGDSAIIYPDDIYSENSTATPVVAVNGQVTPTIVMRPGEIQRWRLIHAGLEDSIQLTTDAPLKMHAIAFDGLATGTIDELSEEDSLLHPGYRLDVLVEAPKNVPEGSAYLVSTHVKDARKSIRNRTAPPTALVKVVVKGPPKTMVMPTAADLNQYAAFKDADVPTDAEVGATAYRVELQLGQDNMMHTFYRINGTAYDPNVVSHKMQLNTAEQWVLKGVGSHPFHIHVNPFAVRISQSGGGTRWRWRDTLLVGDDEQTIRMHLKDFCGKFVLHCHILDHEDQGMMQNIEITTGVANPCRPELTGNVPARNAAPLWTLNDPDGRPFRMAHLRGESTLLVFHRGLACLHCAQQVVSLGHSRRDLLHQGVRIVAISPDLPAAEQLQKIRADYNLGFSLLADPDKKVFSAYDCLGPDGDAMHAVFLIDKEGSVVWKTVGEKPFTDMNLLLMLAGKVQSTQYSLSQSR